MFIQKKLKNNMKIVKMYLGELKKNSYFLVVDYLLNPNYRNFRLKKYDTVYFKYRWWFRKNLKTI